MFEETLKLLKQLEQKKTYTMDILPDEDGYYDKECPNEKCLFKFKVHADDWRNLFSDEAVFCPFCGYNAPSRSWWTTEQVKQAQEQAVQNVKGEIGSAIRTDAQKFNRRNNKGFIKMSMKVSGLFRPIDLPAVALEEMEQKISCEKCNTRYAVIGSAFYCPCCGHNSARQTFFNTIENVNSKIKNIDVVRQAIAQYSKDEAERTCISLLESSVSDVVVAFQRLCESVYQSIDNTTTLKRNVFQRLADGSTLWKNAVGKGYLDWISNREYVQLKICFQQRHSLQHKDGIVDKEYIDKSGDNSYFIGQHIIVRETDILNYAKIIEKLGREIISLLNE